MERTDRKAYCLRRAEGVATITFVPGSQGLSKDADLECAGNGASGSVTPRKAYLTALTSMQK